MLKRAAAVYGVCALLLMAMILRLYWVGQGDAVTRAMADQSRYTLQVGSTRGGIYDCNLKPLVDCEEQAVSAVIPTTHTLPVGEAQVLLGQPGQLRNGIVFQRTTIFLIHKKWFPWTPDICRSGFVFLPGR